MVNATKVISPIIHGYSGSTLDDTLAKDQPRGYKLEFSLNLNPKGKARLSGETPFMAALELSMYAFGSRQANTRVYDGPRCGERAYWHEKTLRLYMSEVLRRKDLTLTFALTNATFTGIAGTTDLGLSLVDVPLRDT